MSEKEENVSPATEQQATSNRRIAKNALMLYIRMFLMMIVGLYTSRVVLQALGVEDFGIYNVVGSIVAMFTILSNTLASAISRFLTFELGKKDKEKLNHVFCTSIIIQFFLAIIILIAIESVGWWFVYNKLQIPPNRLNSAIWVMHLSVLTFAINLISVPYNALIIAHEKMSAFAYISIIEALLKLGIALLLTIVLYDKLIIYAVLMAAVAIVLRLIYGIYSKWHFEEARFHFLFDKKLLKEMFSFAGWNFIGASSVVLRDQGGNIILNIFCGPAVNAARGICIQVYGAITQFATNFQTAFNPQIIKSYAHGDQEYMHSIIMRGARFSFYLLLLLSLPILLETEFVLHVWLKIVPEHASNFTRLMLLFALSESLAQPIVTGMLASGNIKTFQIIAGSIQLLNLPVAYLSLRLGARPESVFIVALIISQITFFAKLILVRPLIDLNIEEFIKKVYLNVLSVMAISIFVPAIVYFSMESGVMRFVTCSLVSVFSVLVSVFTVGLSDGERAMVIAKIKEFKTRYF